MTTATFPKPLFSPGNFGYFDTNMKAPEQIGYFCWSDTSGDEILHKKITYWVNPDGSATKLYTTELEGSVVKISTQKFPDGAWKPQHMYGSFGSRGGCEIVAVD